MNGIIGTLHDKTSMSTKMKTIYFENPSIYTTLFKSNRSIHCTLWNAIWLNKKDLHNTKFYLVLSTPIRTTIMCRYCEKEKKNLWPPLHEGREWEKYIWYRSMLKSIPAQDLSEGWRGRWWWHWRLSQSHPCNNSNCKYNPAHDIVLEVTILLFLCTLLETTMPSVKTSYQ